MFRALQRVKVEWRFGEDTPLETIAEEMSGQDSVCAIVNLRRHARQIVGRLSELCPKDTVFYLTTDLCPAHRSKQIKRIRERLKNNLPCRVVATQCIEAGVDLDFRTMYRALAPLDAIIQAAGRCNRNGGAMGRVTVFCPADPRMPYPDQWYSNAAVTVQEMEPPFSIQRLFPLEQSKNFTVSVGELKLPLENLNIPLGYLACTARKRTFYYKRFLKCFTPKQC